MNHFLGGFCLTLISTIFWPVVPDLSWWPWLILLGLSLIKVLPMIAGGLLAMTYFCWYLSGFFHITEEILVSNNKQQVISAQAAPVPLKVRGEIISLVEGRGDWLKADIRVMRTQDFWKPDLYIRLSWSSPPVVKIGEVWDFTLKSKSISSVMNEGGFNQQRYLLSQHILAKGKVIRAEFVNYQPSKRQILLSRIAPVMENLATGDLLSALLLGDKTHINTKRWQQLRQTGTGHLVAISGLHLSVISAWLYLSILFLINRLASYQGWRNTFLALAIASIGALGYAYFSGFALPTQRALIMLLMLLLLSIFRRYASSWERLLYALSLVLLLDPLSVLSAGFWLSFGALSIILLSFSSAADKKTSSGKLFSQHRLKDDILLFANMQLRLAIGLGVLQAFLFDTVTLHSFWFNALMVPWFSLVVIPLTLLGGLFWFAIEFVIAISLPQVFYPAQWSLFPFISLLNISDGLLGSQLGISNDWKFLLLGLLCLLLISRFFTVKPVYWRWLLILPLMPMLIFACQKILLKFIPVIADDKKQALTSSLPWQLHLLDVGQGLSVVINRQDRAVIYDTGAAYGQFTYAERSVLPFLTAKGLTELDYLIVSHGDNDHAGGAKIITSAFPDAQLVSDVIADATMSCRPKTLNWQGLKLEFLAPKEPEDGNDGSCVVRVSDGNTAVLLSGDIEKNAERSLLISRILVASDILIAPHHGSRTSSTPAFIKAVQPQLVLFAAGWNNPYGFPKADIVARYQQQGAITAISGELGQISIDIDPDKGWEMASFRDDIAPFWYNQLFGFGTNTKAE